MSAENTSAEIFPPGFSGEADDDFQMTHKELDQIKDALKDANFRKLLSEYVQDVQSPESQATYQSEVRQLEKERGNTIHFLNPMPGYVLKTSVDGDRKAFINICSNPIIRKFQCESSTQADRQGYLWSIPYALSPPREDFDKSGKMCAVYDVIFNPVTIVLATRNTKLREKIESTAIEAVEKSYEVKLDKNNVKRPKATFKGMTRATIIKYKTGANPPDIIDINAIKNELPPQPRKCSAGTTQTSSPPKADATPLKKQPPVEQPNATKTDLGINGNEKPTNKHTEPNYKLKYRSHVDMQDYCFDNQREGRSSKPIPEEIILTIDLPMLRSSASVDADVVDNGRIFEMKSDGKIKYYLNLKLPFQVRCDATKATFDKDKRKLTISMKTVQKKGIGSPSIDGQSVISVLDENYADDVRSASTTI